MSNPAGGLVLVLNPVEVCVAVSTSSDVARANWVTNKEHIKIAPVNFDLMLLIFILLFVFICDCCGLDDCRLLKT